MARGRWTWGWILRQKLDCPLSTATGGREGVGDGRRGSRAPVSSVVGAHGEPVSFLGRRWLDLTIKITAFVQNRQAQRVNRSARWLQVVSRKRAFMFKKSLALGLLALAGAAQAAVIPVARKFNAQGYDYFSIVVTEDGIVDF